MQNYQTHYLFPSTLFAEPIAHEITTILGSCVSVCLWDFHLKVGGINHYMLPLWNREGLASPKYGNIAIEKLLEKMYLMGCLKKHLCAKVFGGSEQMKIQSSHFNIGKRNILLANDLLAEKNIPIIASSLGGNRGRKIKFYSDTGDILLKYL